MATAIYKDPIIRKLIEKLTEEGPEALRGRYIYGDPVLIGKSRLPACFITKERTDIRVGDNMNDEHLITVALNVVYDARADLNTPGEVIGMNSLYDIVEGRLDDYSIRPDSLAGIMRKYQVLDGDNRLFVSVGSDTEIVYGTDVRGDGVYTTEAVVRVTLRQLQPRPNLS